MALPKIEFSTESTDKDKADALVLGWFQPERGKKDSKESKGPVEPVFVGKKNKDIDHLSGLLKKSGHFSAKKNEVSSLRFFETADHSNTVLLGLGTEKKWGAEIARQAGAALVQSQKRERYSKVAVQADSVFGTVPPKEFPDYLQAFIEGYYMGGYEYRDLKKEEPELFSPSALRFLGTKSSQATDAAARAKVTAEAVNFARSLGDRPGNILTPTEFARIVDRMAKERGLKCSVMGRNEMEKLKMGLLLGVAKGSTEEPKFIILDHKGGKKGDKPVVLIGKGITFDSGGISLKPAQRMEDMKYDMMGAGTVAGVMQAVSDLKVPANIIGIIAAAENMPSGSAQKPGDVARSMSGKTVEIINTDAEGRLILADALEYAQKEYDPEAIFDFATLTGAVVDALGSVVSGIMGNNKNLIDRLRASSEVTGERVWELPLYDEYEEDLRSHVADIKNSGIREAGSSKGGTFLKFFVDQKYPWVHCDIAGTSYHRRDLNYHPQKFGAGVMVRLMLHLLQNWKPISA